MKLTARTVAALRLDGKTDLIVFDEDMSGFGFRLRLGSGGKVLKGWIAQYKHAGATRRITLGSAEVLSAEQARLKAKKVLAAVALGADPQAERINRRGKDKNTLRTVITEYLAIKEREVRPHTLRQVKRYLGGDYFKVLHAMPIDTISRRDIASRLVAISRAHTSIVAAQARAALSAFFAWAMQSGIVEANPVIGTPKPDAGEARERVLSDHELAALWRACRDDAFGKITRLLILLGARRQAIGGILWSELDLERGLWRVPAERSKNHRPHELPLLPAALDIIRSVPKMVSRDQLFGARAPDGFTMWGREKRLLDQRSGVSEWSLHDLRRTLSTRLHDLGIAPHVVEEILGHRAHRRGSAGVYNYSRYEREVRAALALWEDHIRSLVEGGERKIVLMPSAAG